MIKYDYEITVNGNQAKLNKDIYLFRGNKNVHYYFAVKNASFNFKGSTDLIEKTNAINAAVTVIKPNNVEVASAIAKVENGKIHLKVTEDLIDEEVEVGDFDLVFDLFDDTDGAVTIPKVIGQFHVLERPCTTPISELVATNTTNEVDQALTDYAIVTYAEPVASTNADGTFAKKTWVAKEKITTAELNRMEEGISDVSSQCKDIANLINENYFILKSPNGTQYKINVTDSGTLQVIGNIDEKLDGLIENRILVWHDEFNGNSLDINNWNYELGVVRHNEPQYYRRENVIVKDSNLILKAKREDFKDRSWTSGSIHTNNKAEFRNGRFEAKMKLSSNISSFPAFWLYGAIENEVYTDEDGSLVGIPGCHFPRCGEIDIIEHMNNYVQVGAYYNTTWDITDNNENDYLATSQVRRDDSTIDFTQYHIFALEKTQTELKYYIDDILLLEVPINETNKIFKEPYFIILDQCFKKC